LAAEKENMEENQETTIDMTTLPKNEEIHPVPSWETLEDNAQKNGIWSLRDDAKSVSFIALGKTAGVMVDGYSGDEGGVAGTEALLTLAVSRFFGKDAAARFSEICDKEMCVEIGNYLMSIILTKKS
jgi:hypothetical protein